MIYQKFQPCKLLKPFVECYFVWQSVDELIHDLVIESPPNGFCSIVFNSGDSYFLHNKKYDRLAVPKQFIAGQSIYSYKLFLNGNISIAGIVFKPAALATLFQFPMYDYTEERIDLKSVLEASFIDQFANKLDQFSEASDKAKLLEEFVITQYNKTKPTTDYIDEIANLIVEKNGMLNINEVLKNVYMSRRNFERKFFRKVGLSPKYYARIRRVGYLMAFIAGKKNAEWPKIFNQCGYYDQSHFIKDFIEFTGRTPHQYLAENTELANFVEKPKEQTMS